MLYKFDGKQPQISKLSYVSPTAFVIGDVEINAHCYIGHGAIIRGDYGRIEIGWGTAVEEGVIIHAPPGEIHSIGSRVTLGHGAICHGLEIGDEAVIGMGAILSIRSIVGAGSIIAEGGIVKLNSSIPENVVAGGNPAAIIRDVKEKDRELWNYGKQLYIDLAQKYLDIGMELVKESICNLPNP
jgi:carbonic anhydrase/acetyltransferase-like protein (isoleucine patch superfamily)